MFLYKKELNKFDFIETLYKYLVWQLSSHSLHSPFVGVETEITEETVKAIRNIVDNFIFFLNYSY